MDRQFDVFISHSKQDRQFDVFISHSKQDQELAEQLANKLSAAGIRVWRYRKIIPGEMWVEEIEKGIEQSQHVLLIVSEDSLNSPSANFEMGVVLRAVARSPERLVIPVLTQDIDLSSLPFSTKTRRFVEAAHLSLDELDVKVREILGESCTANSLQH